MIRYEVRYVEIDAKWTPADPKRVRRMLAELPKPDGALSWMADGYNWRTNFADYRIRTADLSLEAQKRRIEIEAKEVK